MCDQIGECGGDDGLDLLHGRAGGPEPGGEAGDASTGEAAGNDEVEVVEVGGDIESQAVHGDPAPDAHPDGADFFAGVIFAGAQWGGGPDTGGARFAVGVDSEGSAGLDGGFFEKSDVVVESQAEEVEVEDGVDDELSRAVVGDVAAAIGVEKFDAQSLQEFRWRAQVAAGGGPARDGDDGWVMFDQENHAGAWCAGVAKVERFSDEA